MSNTAKKVLLILMIVLLIAVLLFFGGFFYVKTHVFVEKTPYPISAQSLDLREKEISFEHYDSLHAQLPNCQVVWNVPFQGGKLSNETQSLAIESLTERDIEILSTYFEKLTRVDASACSDYAILEKLKETIPELEVQYTVSLGTEAFAPDTAELVLEAGQYDYDTLTKNLAHLPLVTRVQLKTPELTLEQIDALREAYPEVEITCTVDILGQEYDMETTELDLSALTSEGVAEAAD